MTEAHESELIDRIARELWQIEVDDEDEPGPAAYEPWAHEWRARAERILRVIEDDGGPSAWLAPAKES